MTTYTFAFKKNLIAKLHEHFAEYQRDPESAWKRIALELSTDGDHTAHRWQDLSAYFKRSLVYKLEKFSQDQEFVDRLQYPCLRKVYSVVVELIDKTTDVVVNRRKDIVEENKLFLKSLIDDSYDPAVVAAYKRRSVKKTRITVSINVGDQEYNLTPSQRELLMKMEQQRKRKNKREKVRRQVEPGTWHDAATGSPVVLDGVPVTIENAPSPAKNERSARRLLDEESLDVNTQEYDQMIKDSMEPEMPPIPVRKRLLSSASTVESEEEEEVLELSSTTDADASDGANGISISEDAFVVINPDEILSESTINTTTTLQLDPLQLSVQQSQAPQPATQTAENAEKDSTTSEPLFTPSSGESAKSTTTTGLLAPVPSMIYRTDDLIARSQPPTLILEENAATEKLPTVVVKIEAAEVGDPVEIVISDERIAEGPPNPEDSAVTVPSNLQPATSSNGPVEPSVNDVTRQGPAETTSSAVQNDEPAMADQTADRSIGSRTVATQTPPAKVIPVVDATAPAPAVAKVSAVRRSLCVGNSTWEPTPRTSDGFVVATFFLSDGDEEEEEEEEDGPTANPTVDAVAEQEISSNPSSNEAEPEVEVRVEVPKVPTVDGMDAEPEGQVANNVDQIPPATVGNGDLKNCSVTQTLVPPDVFVPDVAVVPAATDAVVSEIYSTTPRTEDGFVAKSFFLDDDEEDEGDEDDDEPAANPTVDQIPPATAGIGDLNNNSQPNTSNVTKPPSPSPASAAENGPPPPSTAAPGTTHLARSYTPVPDSQESAVDQEALQLWSKENLLSRSYFYDSLDEESDIDDDHGSITDGQVQETVAVVGSVAAPAKIVEKATDKPVPEETEPEQSTENQEVVLTIPEITNSKPKTSNAERTPSPTPALAVNTPPPPPPPASAVAPGTCHLTRSYSPPSPGSVDYEIWSPDNLLSGVGAVQRVASDEESEEVDDDSDGSSISDDQVTEPVGGVAAPSAIVVEKATDKSLQVESEPEKRTSNLVDNSDTSSDDLTNDDVVWKERDKEDDDEDEEADNLDKSEDQPAATDDRRNAEPAPSTSPTPPQSSKETKKPDPPLAVKSKLQRWHAHHAALEPFVHSHYALYDSLRQCWPQLFQPTSPVFHELNDLNSVITTTIFPHLDRSNPARIVQFRYMVDALAIRIAYGTTLQELLGPQEPTKPPPPPAVAGLPEEEQRDTQRSWEIEVTSSWKSVATPPATKRVRIDSSAVLRDDGQNGIDVSIVTIPLSDSEDSPSVVLPVRKKRKYRVRQT